MSTTSSISSYQDGDNCSNTITNIPYANDYYASLVLGDKITLGIGGSLTIITICVFLFQLRWMYKCDLKSEILFKVLWLLALYPVASITSLIASVAPRSALLNEFVASGYLSICLYKFVGLIELYYGGEEMMLEKKKGFTIVLRGPPVACCCFCCPELPANRKNITRIQWLVLQNAVVKPTLTYIAAILWTEDLYENTVSVNNVGTYIIIINGISTLTGMYGLIIMFRSSKADLKHYYLAAKFACLQLVLIFMNLQKLIFNILATHNIPACANNVSSKVKGNVLYHQCMVLEMFILTWVASYYYLKSVGKYRNACTSPSEEPKQAQVT